MEDIYMLSDAMILTKIGERLKTLRLKQNIKGEIGSFDSLLRVLRTLGKLNVLLPLVEDEQLSPSEYYELVQKAGAHQRKRAAGKSAKNDKEELSW